MTAVAAFALWRRSLNEVLRVRGAMLPATVAPVVFLLGMSGQFGRLTGLDGFPTDSYLSWIVPLSCLQGAGFAGAATGSNLARDIEQGWFDRLLVAPVPRAAADRSGRSSARVTRSLVPATVVLVVGLALGAELTGGVPGLVALYVACIGFCTVGRRCGASFIALTFRTQQAGPLMQQGVFLAVFLSTAYTPEVLLRGWLASVAPYNPVTYVLELARQATVAGIEPSFAHTWPGLVALAGMLAVARRAGVARPAPDGSLARRRLPVRAAQGGDEPRPDAADGLRAPALDRARAAAQAQGRRVRRPAARRARLRDVQRALRLDAPARAARQPLADPRAQELHLRDLSVRIRTDYASKALGELGLDEKQMRFLLWDRLLQRELAAARKSVLVNKTPNDVFIADLLAECWPDARFIYLLRHPGAIARSRQETRPQDTPERNARMVLRYGNAIEAARAARPGLALRYEELTTDPKGATQRLCEFLGVPWEASMLEYGRYDHGRLKPGLGDWKAKIKSGAIQTADPPPPAADIHPSLLELCAAWGYEAAPAVQPAS